MYSFSGNSAASAPISTFMCLGAIYIFPGSVHIFPTTEKADPSREYIIRSQTHECGNWDCGPDIPFLGIFVSNFLHFFFAVQIQVWWNLTIFLEKRVQGPGEDRCQELRKPSQSSGEKVWESCFWYLKHRCHWPLTHKENNNLKIFNYKLSRIVCIRRGCFNSISSASM